MRPTEDAFTLGSKAHEALATFDDQNAEAFFQLFDARGQGGLSHAARGGSARKMPLAGERRQVLKVANYHSATSCPTAPSSAKTLRGRFCGCCALARCSHPGIIIPVAPDTMRQRSHGHNASQIQCRG
jgi:hypothetical protein